MLYRRFGRTEISMPLFSLGGMRYQMNMKDDIPETLDVEGQANLEATLGRALELGINHIETARGYGTSEYQLGLALKGVDRSTYILQSKSSPLPDPKKFMERFERSLELLNTDHLDLFTIHGINDELGWNHTFRKGGALDAALQLKKEGRIKHIGFSSHATSELISRSIESGAFDYVNLHWYYIMQWNRECIEKAAKHDMGVFIISPNDKGGMLYRPSDKLTQLTQPFSPMVYNDIFCLSNPHVHTLSLGAAEPSDFDEHIKSLHHLENSQSDLAVAKDRCDRELSEHLKKEDLGTDWLEALPNWDVIPGQVNLKTILWLWSLVKAYDMTEYGVMRYNLLGSGGNWFAGQKVEDKLWPEIEKKLHAYPHLNKIKKILNDAHSLMDGAPQKRLSES